MTTVFLLFLVGIVLVAVEILVPGGLLGLVGGLCLLAGVVASFTQFGTGGGVVATVLAFLIGAVTVYMEFVILPKSKLAKKFTMAETVNGRSQPAVADHAAVIGREVVAVTKLAPSGVVTLDGRRYEAYSQSGLTEAGARLKVVDTDNFRLVVTQIKETS